MSSGQEKQSNKLFPLRKRPLTDLSIDVRMSKVSVILFRQMSNAVDHALNAIEKPEEHAPLIIHVFNIADNDDYYLAYYPKNKVIALRILQLLYVMNGRSRTDFINALCPRHGFPSLNDHANASNFVINKVGTRNTGVWECTRDIDDLERFSATLYIQQCITLR